MTDHQPTKGERREAIVKNNRKMRMSGRSTLLLSELSRQPKRPKGQKESKP